MASDMYILDIYQDYEDSFAAVVSPEALLALSFSTLYKNQGAVYEQHIWKRISKNFCYLLALSMVRNALTPKSTANKPVSPISDHPTAYHYDYINTHIS